MGHSRLHYIPLALFIYFPVAFSITFIIALTQGHINFAYSYISDTGTLPPEQYVFAQLVNMGAALWAYFIYIRFIQVEQYMKLRYSQHTPIGNTIALAFGFTACLGMSLVGNFPELHNKAVHLIGAFLVFVGGSIYMVYQGYYTFKLLPHFQSKTIAYIRTYMGILGLMLYFSAQTTVILAFQRVKSKKNPNLDQSVKWSEADGGYEFQAASVIMEWLLFAIFDLFLLTYVPEFKKLKLDAPPVKFLVDTEIVPLNAGISNEGLDDGDGDAETMSAEQVVSRAPSSSNTRLPLERPTSTSNKYIVQ